jgi:hypothetical protein
MPTSGACGARSAEPSAQELAAIVSTVSWTWALEAGDGSAVTRPAAPPQPSQSDAESWLGENWRQLAEDGVAQVSLYEGDVEVYGPMPLSE